MSMIDDDDDDDDDDYYYYYVDDDVLTFKSNDVLFPINPTFLF